MQCSLKVTMCVALILRPSPTITVWRPSRACRASITRTPPSTANARGYGFSAGPAPFAGACTVVGGEGTSADVELSPFGTVTSSNEKETARLTIPTTIANLRPIGGGAASTECLRRASWCTSAGWRQSRSYAGSGAMSSSNSSSAPTSGRG